MDLQTVPKINTNASLTGVTLTQKDAFVLSRVNGVSSIAEIQKIVGFDKARILQVFQKLVDHKLVILAEQVAVEEVVKTDKKITNMVQKRIRQMFELVERGDHYTILGVAKGSSAEVIEKAYFKLSKEFHPDRFFKEPLGPFKKMLEEVFNGIQESYQVLSDPDLKKQYFQQQRQRKIAPEPVKKPIDNSPLARRLKNVEYDLSSASSQYEMGQKEEEKGNLKAALNFYKMAAMFDGKNQVYKQAYIRVKDALKDPLKAL
ncbi:MAG: J domain-containing protein [Bdellovibrionota bacterium]